MELQTCRDPVSQQPCGAGWELLESREMPRTLPTPGLGLGMTLWIKQSLTGLVHHHLSHASPFSGQTSQPQTHGFSPVLFPSMFGSLSCNSHLFHQDLCWSPSPFKPDHPYQQGPRYPIFHSQYPRRAEEHVDTLHKATIRDPLVEMNYNLQMIKTQLTVVGRYLRLCRGAVQMRSYQDLRCPKHLSILG